MACHNCFVYVILVFRRFESQVAGSGHITLISYSIRLLKPLKYKIDKKLLLVVVTVAEMHHLNDASRLQLVSTANWVQTICYNVAWSSWEIPHYSNPNSHEYYSKIINLKYFWHILFGWFHESQRLLFREHSKYAC